MAAIVTSYMLCIATDIDDRQCDVFNFRYLPDRCLENVSCMVTPCTAGGSLEVNASVQHAGALEVKASVHHAGALEVNAAVHHAGALVVNVAVHHAGALEVNVNVMFKSQLVD